MIRLYGRYYKCDGCGIEQLYWFNEDDLPEYATTNRLEVTTPKFIFRDDEVVCTECQNHAYENGGVGSGMQCRCGSIQKAKFNNGRKRQKCRGCGVKFIQSYGAHKPTLQIKYT